MEATAAARFAFHPQPAPHGFHQPQGDRQTKARTAVLASGGGVGLRERLEDLLLLLTGNSDPRIADGKVNGHCVRVPACDPSLDHDLATGGELEGITDQISHYQI